MVQTTIRIEGMACEHCVKAVTRAVSALPGIMRVTVSLESKTAEVEYDAEQVTLDAIKAAIAEEGYVAE